MSGPITPPSVPAVDPRRPKRRSGLQVLERSQWVPAKTYEAFAYFTDPASLSALALPWLQFRLVSPRTLEVQEGAEVDYEYALHGIAVRCRARIQECKPSVALAHEQVTGPYAHWRHRQTFRSERGGTRIGDRIEYVLPLDPWSRPVQALYVRPLLERVLEHRGTVVARRFRPVQLW